LSEFNETLVSSQVFQKNAQISKFMKIRLVGAELFHADRRTHDKANSRFSQFCERAKKSYLRCKKFSLLRLGQMETILCVMGTCGGAGQLLAVRMCIGFNVNIH
jgi:hypothetical protein